MPMIMHKGAMAKGCHHTNRKKRYYSRPYFLGMDIREQPTPTEEEVRRHRLWQAPCGHWVSFLGKVSNRLTHRRQG